MELRIFFKKESQNCSSDNLESYRPTLNKNPNFNFDSNYVYDISSEFHSSNPKSLSDIGIKNISCSFDKGKNVDINVSNQWSEDGPPVAAIGQSLLFKWNINTTSQILVSNLKEGPMITQLSGTVIEPMVTPFLLKGTLLVFYATHNKQPNNNDIEELKAIALRTSKLDLNKYDLDFEPQDDGSLKYKFKLKTESQWTESTFPIPIPK